MPELRLLGFLADRHVKVGMRGLILLLIHVDVAPVEVHEGVIVLLLYGLVIVSLGQVVLPNVVVREPAVVIEDRVRRQTDGLSELIQGLLVVFILEVGKSQVVVDAGVLILKLDGLL